MGIIKKEAATTNEVHIEQKTIPALKKVFLSESVISQFIPIKILSQDGKKNTDNEN